MAIEAVLTKDLWHVYPGNVKALRGVNLTVREGEFIALVGRNGSGKTTLVKHFNGLLKPTTGSVYVYGEETTSLTVAKLSSTVGYVFQNPDHMLFAETIEDEVAYGPRNLKLPEDQVKKMVDEALETVGLSEYRKESPFFFGKGMRRKITLAAILAMRPRVLVIDEPTTGMDYRSSIEVMNLLKKIHSEGHTIIIVLHDMRIVADYALRTIVMNDGNILLDGPTREVFIHADTLSKAFLKPPQITRVAQKLGELSVPPDILKSEELYEILVKMLPRQ